jgi:hypothetical protein
MKIIRPTRGKDFRLWAWYELSAFTKSLLAAVLVLPLVAVLFIPELRHPIGTYSEMEGVVRSIGSYGVGGGALHGRTAVVAVVTLSNGKVVQAGIRQGLLVASGSKVIVRESPQNFGQPLYGIYSVSEPAR